MTCGGLVFLKIYIYFPKAVIFTSTVGRINGAETYISSIHVRNVLCGVLER